ncbi:MAG: hypothetical protein K8I30_13880, partial [Anaerolineae bacterium]|nr:hypothetical protein [Anaerolineae bacterium]
RQGLAEMQRVLKPGGRIVIFDLRVPKRPEQFFSLATLAHLTMHAGVDDLASLVEQMGYGAVECGVLPWKTIGYIRARRP